MCLPSKIFVKFLTWHVSHFSLLMTVMSFTQKGWEWSFHSSELFIISSAEVIESLDKLLRHLIIIVDRDCSCINLSLNVVVNVSVSIANDDCEDIIVLVLDLIENIVKIGSVTVTWFSISNQEENIFAIFYIILYQADISYHTLYINSMLYADSACACNELKSSWLTWSNAL